MTAEKGPSSPTRSQQTFQDLDHLSAQIGQDAQQARQVLLPQVVG